MAGQPRRIKKARTLTLKGENWEFVKKEAVVQDRSVSYIVDAFLDMERHRRGQKRGKPVKLETLPQKEPS